MSEIGLSATVFGRWTFGLFSGIRVTTLTLMIEEDRHSAKWRDRPSGRSTGKGEGENLHHRGHEGHRGAQGKHSLDAPFRAHLCLVFIRRRDSESIPAVVAAYSGVW